MAASKKRAHRESPSNRRVTKVETSALKKAGKQSLADFEFIPLNPA
jgi:hypothetical protein